MDPAETSVVILCGGRGTRLQEHTPTIPKPLVEIGGRPIVWHVVQIYLAQGFRRFLLCTGYKGELVARFAREVRWPGDATVECLDTGLDTPTGGRALAAARRLGEAPFCLTYADGVADIDLHALLAAHRAHGGLATVTVVRPELPFGVVQIEPDGRVSGFREKPRAEQWVNGGFCVFEPGVRDYLADDSILEREPLERLAADRELHAYRHEGFWDCMDTYKDAVLLNDLWEQGLAPWKARTPA
ncbi:MAG TPA: sugar phosphate nucleotidyltransferase [Conexibacter sp.]|nr:sugar phosphate nucleotidyltransferase [Conexibacter sp.]